MSNSRKSFTAARAQDLVSASSFQVVYRFTLHADGMTLLNRSKSPAVMCPECGHRATGTLTGVLAAHWRENHIDVMPWHLAWPLLRDGIYVPLHFGRLKRKKRPLTMRRRHAGREEAAT